ncbi:uncharacterized protein LOC132725749 [Ruditapes philippinarum]|uniref:uncharacterized protein LOC132725749 n=1 Tax=Ruditapes philippinarum TaxID=129788 RepID=UPI00295B5D99|nr:uncharacterized protein LOC132725749 [Ruditapes philippinarum]
MLHAKNILKVLCASNLGWDDPVPDELAKRWALWINDMYKLSEFSVTRCLKPAGFGEVKSATLHHFSDASEIGYSIVSFIRLLNKDNRVHCAFVIGKSRVAPMKQITVPRLELTTATVAVRTDKMLKSEIDIKLDESVFWTDSMAVLRFIENSSARFQTFVANRLSVIHDGSNPEQWRYIPTKINPGDIASRGITVDELNKSWIVAPDFLWKDESKWPADRVNQTISNDDPEVKKVNFVKYRADNVLSPDAREVLDKLISYLSSWYKLKRAVAWILKICEKLLHRAKTKGVSVAVPSISEKKPYVTFDDLKHAEMSILRYTQKCAFPEEIETLTNNESTCRLKRNSVIRNLDPIMEDGLLRVGGRLQDSAMPEERKHPVILPKNYDVSKLILREIHERLNHVGRNHTLSVLREKYWLINGPSAVRKVISKCVVCRRQNASVGEQKMSNLPRDRVTPDELPFTRVGVDYFGPFEVKQGRSLVKRYGVLFTCLTSRAIHLEVAASLDTDSYINALRRFIARRGQVTTIRSDNGSNFVGAERELKASIQEWNINRIQDTLRQKHVDWKFIPPA